METPPVMAQFPKAELVSVVIPCHNYAHFLGEAINSVVKQSYPNIEIIVVDDGSTDNTAKTITTYPTVQYIRQDNLGVARARNIGLSRSRGAFVLFLDADDRLLPHSVEAGVRALEYRPDCAFAFGLCVFFGIDGGLRELPADRQFNYDELLERNFIGNPGQVLYRRSVFSHVQGFDEFNGPAADYDLYLRIARLFPIVCHYHPVVQYRRHEHNMSNDPRVMLRATLTALANQRKHVAKHPELREAYKRGRYHWQNYFGEPLIVRMYQNFKKGDLVETGRDAYTLVRLFPGRISIFGRRKITKAFHALKNKLF